MYSLVSRKIDIRDKILGYTTCLRELLWSHSDITQKSIYNSLHRAYFPLFFPVIHCPLPQMDELWGQVWAVCSLMIECYSLHDTRIISMTNLYQALSSSLDYDTEIAQFPFLDSERELILRAMLDLTPVVPDCPGSAIRTPRKLPRKSSGRMEGGEGDGGSDAFSTSARSSIAMSSVEGGRVRGRQQRQQRPPQQEEEESRNKRKRVEEVFHCQCILSIFTLNLRWFNIEIIQVESILSCMHNVYFTLQKDKDSYSQAVAPVMTVPVATPPRHSTRSTSETSTKPSKTTPSRMRILRKFGEC